MAKSRLDLTTGKPIKQILLFSLPLVMGSLFQQMYSFVDTIMVGRLISSDALAAVGSVSSLNFLVIGFVGGTCSGFATPLAWFLAMVYCGILVNHFLKQRLSAASAVT